MFGEAWSPMSVPDLAPDDDDDTYTDFLASKLCKILIFSQKICQNTDFSWNGKRFLLYILFSHKEIFHKILIFLVIYTDFVLDQSGRSALTHSLILACLCGRCLPNHPSKHLPLLGFSASFCGAHL